MGQLNRGRNRIGEGLGDKAHCFLPSPTPLSFSFLGSAFVCLKLLLYPNHKSKKHTKKKPPATQATKTFLMLSTTCSKYIILLMIHITDENGRPYHLQNQYLPLLHNWTVCQRKNSPSWSMSML